MFYFTIGQKLAISLVSTAIILNIPYFLEKLKRRSEEDEKDKLAEASRLTNEARNLIIKSKQIQEEFLLDDKTFAIPGPSSGKLFCTSTINSSKTKNESERGANLVNTLLILGEDGEFVESIKFTDKDYADALNATQMKNKSNFMKNCFK